MCHVIIVPNFGHKMPKLFQPKDLFGPEILGLECSVSDSNLLGGWTTAAFGQYPRRPTQSGTVPLFVEQFQFLWNSSTVCGTVP